MGILLYVSAAAALLASACASLELQFGRADDLTSFVTRPEIKAPILEVHRKAKSGIAPGYWFVAPYAFVLQDEQPAKYYQACSTGPAIYDADGELVWSGACKLQNQNVHDFRTFRDEAGVNQLSTIVLGYEAGLDGMASILDTSYEFTHNFTTPVDEHPMNMHEWRVIDNGRSALYLTTRPILKDVREVFNSTEGVRGWVAEIGIREVDINSGQIKFEWWSEDKISLLETSALEFNLQDLNGPPPNCWNWFHSNSIDKDAEGNYILSGRFVDTLYKISPTGDILWRLGGKHSSFYLDGFNFSKQHDARFMGWQDGKEIISLFDNGHATHNGLNVPATSKYSSAIVVALDHSTMSATLLRRIIRPDGGQTSLRGNFQTLPNGNSVVCWSENAYISEYGKDDELLLEARFKAKRFATYRGYKFNFTGNPTEPPVVKAFAFGETPDTSTTVWYASWNGATEVTEWRFFGGANSTFTTPTAYVGSAQKAGFETTFSSDGFNKFVYAEAVAKDGTVLGRTSTEKVALPSGWTLPDTSRKSHVVGRSFLESILSPACGKDEL